MPAAGARYLIECRFTALHGIYSLYSLVIYIYVQHFCITIIDSCNEIIQALTYSPTVCSLSIYVSLLHMKLLYHNFNLCTCVYTYTKGLLINRLVAFDLILDNVSLNIPNILFSLTYPEDIIFF